MVALSKIQGYVDEVARRFHPQRVILFGSHATGSAREDSDVDLLVVMDHEGSPAAKAAEIRSAIERDFSLDLLVRDPRTLRWRIENNDWFLRDVERNGIVLHEAADARMG